MSRPARPVLQLVLRRLAHRPVDAATIAVALAVGAGIIGVSSIVGALAQEQSIRAQIGELTPAARALHVTYRTSSNSNADALGAAAARALGSFRAISQPPVQIRVWDPVSPADERGFRVVHADNPARALVVSAGRLPRRCVRSLCEALSFDRSLRVGRVLTLHGERGTTMRARIVGRGTLASSVGAGSEVVADRALLLPERSQAGASLVRGRASLVVLSAALRPDAVHGYELTALIERLREAGVRLQRTDPSLRLAAPTTALGGVERLVEVSRRRLLIVAGQGAALILAFAAFVATARRRQVKLQHRQLIDLAAARRQAFLARAAEATIAGAIGVAVALVVLFGVAEIVGVRRGYGRAFVATALPIETVLSILAVGVVGVALILRSSRPPTDSARVRPLELAAFVALLVIVWQGATTSGLDADAIAAGRSGSALLLLLPALAVFAGSVVVLRALPALLALFERTTRRSSPTVRLAAVHAARNPGRAAAATTFLAVALGTAIFSLNYRSTLAGHARAAADFVAGADWRVSERDDRGLPSVAPLTRFRAVTDESPVPVLRLQASVLEPGEAGGGPLSITVLALPAERLSSIRGWRSDFAAASRLEITRRLRRDRAALRGLELDPGATALRIWARGDPELPRQLVVDLLTPGMQFQHVVLGSVRGQWSRLEAPIAPSARTTIVGIDFPTAQSARPDKLDEGAIEMGGLEQFEHGRWSRVDGIDEWVATPSPGREALVLSTEFQHGGVGEGLRFEINGAAPAHLRAPTGTPAAVPALVGAPVARRAVDGVVTAEILGRSVAIRPIARGSLFPSVTSDPAQFVVVDFSTLFALLNVDRPGVAPPSEAWFFGAPRPNRDRLLERAPFRVRALVDMHRLRLARESDPLAAGTKLVLTLTALAGACIGILGMLLFAATSVAAERRTFAEYEAMGVGPRTLGRLLQIRILVLAGAGLVCAAAGAALAVVFVAALVAVGSAGERPLPPIEPVFALAQAAVVLAAAIAGILAIATVLARRTTHEPTEARLRL